jgi:hypothetical protein
MRALTRLISRMEIAKSGVSNNPEFAAWEMELEACSTRTRTYLEPMPDKRPQ